MAFHISKDGKRINKEKSFLESGTGILAMSETRFLGRGRILYIIFETIEQMYVLKAVLLSLVLSADLIREVHRPYHHGYLHAVVCVHLVLITDISDFN